MDDLESPDKFAGGGFEGDDGVGPFVVAFAEAAEIIRAGASGGNENEIALRICGNGGPRVAGTGARSGFERPGNRVPCPAKLSGARVKGTNDAAFERDGTIVAD